MNWGELQQRWDGPRWYFWSLLAAVILIVVTAGVASLLAAAFGQDRRPILALGLIVELLVVCVIGSGMLDGLSRRIKPSGSTHETSNPGAESTTGDDEEDEPDERERREQERKTVRMGIIALPLLIVFLVLLYT